MLRMETRRGTIEINPKIVYIPSKIDHPKLVCVRNLKSNKAKKCTFSFTKSKLKVIFSPHFVHLRAFPFI